MGVGVLSGAELGCGGLCTDCKSSCEEFHAWLLLFFFSFFNEIF